MAEAPEAVWRVENFEVIDSTQEELRRRLLAGDDVDRLVIRAGAQTKGKGQRESDWHSGVGGSYQSVAMRDRSSSDADEATTLRTGNMPLAVAVAIAEAFRERGVDIALKWPNDLYLWKEAAVLGPMSSLPGKVGGVLCHYLRGHLIVGVGLNVRNDVLGAAAALPEFEPAEVSELVLSAVEKAAANFDTRLPERFARFDPLAGRQVKARAGTRVIVGRYDGITPDGCLRLLTDAGPKEMCSGRIVEIDTAASGE